MVLWLCEPDITPLHLKVLTILHKRSLTHSCFPNPRLFSILGFFSKNVSWSTMAHRCQPLNTCMLNSVKRGKWLLTHPAHIVTVYLVLLCAFVRHHPLKVTASAPQEEEKKEVRRVSLLTRCPASEELMTRNGQKKTLHLLYLHSY